MAAKNNKNKYDLDTPSSQSDQIPGKTTITLSSLSIGISPSSRNYDKRYLDFLPKISSKGEIPLFLGAIIWP
jgi:hypothetical protein